MHICTYGFDPIQNLHYKGKSLNSAEDCEVSISAHILEEYTFMHVVCVCVCEHRGYQCTNSQKLFLSEAFKLETCFLTKEITKGRFPGFPHPKMNKPMRLLQIYQKFFKNNNVGSPFVCNFIKYIWRHWFTSWRSLGSSFLSCGVSEQLNIPYSLPSKNKVFSNLAPHTAVR